MLHLQALLLPIIAFMGLAFLLSNVTRKFHQSRFEQPVFGALFGAVIVLGMTNPIVLGEGIIFDTRTLLIGAAVAFVGPAAGAIAMSFGILCRIVIGGAGTITGLAGLVLAFVISVYWVRFAKKRIKQPMIRDISLGVMDTLTLIALFILPFDLAVRLLFDILPTLLISNVIGIVAIGFVLRREKHYFDMSRALEEYATTDQLTKLLNRRGLEAEVGNAKFDPLQGHAVLYFDIDNFKFINDTYGHDVGDAALAILASRLRDIIRGDAVFARHGGDEFSVYFPGVSASAIKPVADRMVAAISDQHFSHETTTFAVSISMGGYWSKSDRSHDFMIKSADQQLLLAKQAGKNRAKVAYDHEDGLAVVA